MNKNGVIVKGIGGFYYVKTEDGEIHEVKAKGRFRKEGIKPLCGDRVEISEGWIENIFERKNVLVRPPVANLDQLLIVISATLPVPDMVMIDKLILSGKYYGLDIILAINKIDSDRTSAEEIAAQYKDSGVRTLLLSAHSKEGIDELKSLLSGKTTALAGQSAVGKSSIVNALEPGISLETGDIISKTEKGKQTTRQSEMIALSSVNGNIIDTPGFAILEGIELEPEKLTAYYPEFTKFGECRYTGCVHDREEGCSVKELVKKGKISGRRYYRYLVILEELRQRRLSKYD